MSDSILVCITSSPQGYTVSKDDKVVKTFPFGHARAAWRFADSLESNQDSERDK